MTENTNKWEERQKKPTARKITLVEMARILEKKKIDTMELLLSVKVE